MENESNSRRSLLHRRPPFHHILLIALFVGLGTWYAFKSLDEVHQEAAERQASNELDNELENRRIAEIEAIKARLRRADPKHEQTCAHAASFRYPEENNESELTHMRRIENCVDQIARRAAH